MRAILWTVLALGVVWGGYWFVGSSAVQKGVEGWFAAQAEAGMVATHDGVSIAGFPSRFDVTVTNPHLADPATGMGWKAPFAQVLSMTWKPWHVIAALPHEQEIDLPLQKITLNSSKMLASLRLVPNSDLPLGEVVLEGHDLAAKSDAGWMLQAASIVMATATDSTRANAQHVGLDVLGLTPDPALTALLPNLGPTVEVVHLESTVTLTAPLDRHLVDTQLGFVSMELKDFHANWGKLKISATGQIVRADAGYAEGQIDFRIEDWRDIPPLIVAMGLVQPAMGKTMTNGLEALAKSGADPEVLLLPLTFKDGRMSLGPLPLGAAPMIGQ